MTERITPDMISSTTLHDIDEAFTALNRSAEELSSGKSIEKPSDEPFGAGRAIELQSALEGLSSYAQNVQEGISWEQTASGALSSIGNVIQRVHELTLAADNGVYSQENLNNLAEQVEQLTESVKQDADVQYAGQYILSGAMTQTAPYTPVGEEDKYHGNEGSISRAIGPGQSIAIGSSAQTLLGNGKAAEDGGLLDVMRTIAADMRAGTPEAREALRGADLGKLEANMQTLITMQTHVGSLITRLQAAEGSLEALHVTTTELLSNTEDANIGQVSIEYSGQQAVYEAALRAGASIVQMSLLEFLK